MQDVFIINPAAGKADASAVLIPRIRAAAAELGLPPPAIECTQGHGHARAIAARYAAAGAPARLFACGGDGTLNEVLQEAVGRPHLALGCVPCGSGNDYVRNFGPAEDFLDIKAQLAGRTATVDVLRTDHGYCVDICAAGLDAQVANAIPRYRRLPGVGGRLSYTMAIVETLLRRMGHRLRITLEGPQPHAETGLYTLLTVCNGQYYGGGYHAAPQARMDDSMLEVLLVPKISRARLLTIIGGYKKGAHMRPDGNVDARYQRYIQAYKAQKVTLEVLDGRPLIVTLDGECAPCTSTLHIELIPRQLCIALPATIPENAGTALTAAAAP